MKRFVTLALVSALVLGASSIVYANVCAFDAVPAATILFPFVALDYNDPLGTSTSFSITNVSAEAQIVHVAIWSDYSTGVLDFNIILTGYDVITMNIRDIFVNGLLPVTSYDPFPSTGAFANGPVSSANIIHAGWLDLMDDPQPTSDLGTRCDANNSSYPGRYTTPIPPSFLGYFQSQLQASQVADRLHSDDCFKPYDDPYTLTGAPPPFWAERDTTAPTWMYITADVVEMCNKNFPDEFGYFVNVANRYDNVLIGDVFWTNTAARLSEAGNAVHLEADMDLGQVATTAPTGFPISFYHRYAQLINGVSDYREPLPTAWAFRYLGAGLANMGTDVRVWKGPTLWRNTYDLERVGGFIPDELVASNCHAYTYYAWDEDEMVTTSTTNPWSGGPSGDQVVPNLIPLETQEVPIEQFDTPGAFGWMLFVWPGSNYPGGTVGTDYEDDYQTWMGVRYNAFGEWSAAMDATVMANYNCFSDQVLPNLGINYDYVDAAGYVISPGN